ncbi:hypothetical protein NBRC10513v2_004173 [Rhodotorula toruloides]
MHGRAAARTFRQSIRKEHHNAKRTHDQTVKHLQAARTVSSETDAADALRVAKMAWSGRSAGYMNVSTMAGLLLEDGFRFFSAPASSPLEIRSGDGFRLAVRTSGLNNSLKAALDRFIARWHQPHFSSRLSVDPNRRGDHRLTLIGVTRAYEEDLRLTSAHTKEPELVETMSADEDLAKLRTYFPSVYDRFASADPGREDPAHPFRCRYGIFPLFCLNYATNSPVHCVEHVDYKNVAGGVCAVLAYGDFDSTKSHYLVFHDLKLAIEFPAGTLALYPSSLLAHSNVSLVEVDSKEDALAGKGQKRGSLVWFAQANYIVSREIGMSLKRAKEKGLPTTYEGLYEHFRTEKGERGVEVVDV